MSLVAQISLIREQPFGERFELKTDFKIPSGQITAVFGPSGSGKTSLLRCIAGLEKRATARIQFREEIWQDHKTFLAPHKRRVGYVFQKQNLFPHLTGQGNLDFAIKRRSEEINQINRASIISELDITHLMNKLPHQMSGGEQQQIAIARSALSNPQLLLMDEPLSSLDESKKKTLLATIKRLNSSYKIPIVFISHSIHEVLDIAEHLVVMKEGKIINNHPVVDALTKFSAKNQLWPEIGAVIDGKIAHIDSENGLAQIKFPGGELWIPETKLIIGANIRLSILAKDMSVALTRQDDSSILNKLPAKIIDMRPDLNPAFVQLHLASETAKFRALITKKSVTYLQLQKKQSVWLQIKSVALNS